MKYQETCDCCGGVVTAYTHNLNLPLVKALRQLVDFFERERKACNLQKDLSLTHNQLANFQKLQYFDLVLRVAEGWLPTEKGTMFIYGETSIKNPVATFKNQILPYDHIAWQSHKAEPVDLSVDEVDQFSYKRREAYQAEKSPQNNLF